MKDLPQSVLQDIDSDDDIDLALQCDAQHLLVGPDAGQGGAPGARSPVFLNPLPVHAEPEHGGHLAECGTHLGKGDIACY